MIIVFRAKNAARAEEFIKSFTSDASKAIHKIDSPIKKKTSRTIEWRNGSKLISVTNDHSFEVYTHGQSEVYTVDENYKLQIYSKPTASRTPMNVLFKTNSVREANVFMASILNQFGVVVDIYDKDKFRIETIKGDVFQVVFSDLDFEEKSKDGDLYVCESLRVTLNIKKG